MDKDTTILLLIIGIAVIGIYAWYQYKESQKIIIPVGGSGGFGPPSPISDPVSRMIII